MQWGEGRKSGGIGGEKQWREGCAKVNTGPRCGQQNSFFIRVDSGLNWMLFMVHGNGVVRGEKGSLAHFVAARSDEHRSVTTHYFGHFFVDELFHM